MKIQEAKHVDYRIEGLRDLPEWADQQIRKVYDDEEQYRHWLRKAGHFYARRYGLLGRKVDQPWPGASDIILPLIDKHITKLKVGYLALIHGPEVPTAMTALDESALANKSSAELYLNSILQGNSPRYSMTDFMEQSYFNVDNMLSVGRGVYWGIYQERTEVGFRQITRDDLPPVMRGLVFAPKMPDGQREAFQAQSIEQGRELNPPEVLAEFGEPISPVTLRVFDRNKEKFREILVRYMSLDTKAKVDRQVADDILGWLRNGLPGGKVLVYDRYYVSQTPRLIDIPPEHCIVPPYARDLTQSQRVTIEQHYHEEEFLKLAADMQWPDEAVEVVAANNKATIAELVEGQQLQDARRHRNQFAQLGDRHHGQIRVRWLYTYKDISGNGIPEPVVLVYGAMDKTQLDFFRYDSPPGYHGWPVIDTRFETNEAHHLSTRSVGEVISDQDRFLTGWHRSKQNNMMIQTSAGLFVRRQSQFDPEANRPRPGVIIELDDVSDAREIQFPQTSLVIEREEEFQMAWVEDHLGAVDNSLVSDQRLLEPRTAREIDQREGARMRVLGFRTRAFNRRMEKAYQLVWGLAQKHAPPVFGVQLTGHSPKQIKRGDIKGEYAVVPIGSVGDMDPTFRMQEAVRRFQFLIQVREAVPDQITHDINVMAAAKMAMDAMGLQESRMLMRERSQDEIEAEVQRRQQQAALLEQFQQAAQRALLNSGNSPEEVKVLLAEMRKEFPHKGLQQIVAKGEAARASAESAMSQSRLARALNGA